MKISPSPLMAKFASRSPLRMAKVREEEEEEEEEEELFRGSRPTSREVNKGFAPSSSTIWNVDNLDPKTSPDSPASPAAWTRMMTWALNSDFRFPSSVAETRRENVFPMTS